MKYLLALVLFATTAQARTFEVRNSKRVIELVGIVNGSSLSIAQQIKKLSGKAKPIYMLINSPGGSVAIGMTIVDAMRAAKLSGVTFKCASAVMAASMAFTILSECDKRYVLYHTRLLFHPISFGGSRMRVQDVVPDLIETVQEERRMMVRLNGFMGLNDEFFHKHYFGETFWAAHRLNHYTRANNFLILVRDIKGFGDLTFQYRQQQRFFFGNIPAPIQTIIKRFEHGGNY